MISTIKPLLVAKKRALHFEVNPQTTEENEGDSDEYFDVKILPNILYNEKSEPTEEFEGKFLDLMDVSGRPTKSLGR